MIRHSPRRLFWATPSSSSRQQPKKVFPNANRFPENIHSSGSRKDADPQEKLLKAVKKLARKGNLPLVEKAFWTISKLFQII